MVFIADAFFLLTGVKFEWQINDPADKDVLNLVEKLGGKGSVKSLEGKSV